MNNDEQRQNLANFLRTRRERLSPSDVGLPSGRRRRTPGLRREEVAQLANIGVSWYTALEQGRDIRPSLDILHSIAVALQLTSAERQHLLVLADQESLFTDTPADEQISSTLRHVLDDLNPDPAYIMGRRWDYLAWNTAAAHILLPTHPTPPYERNAVWQVFTNPEKRIKYPQWEEAAQKILAEFRADSAHYANDSWFKQLIADLQRASEEFRAWWPRHDVRPRIDGRKEIVHPVVGSLLFEHTTLQVPMNPDLKMMIYTPYPGSDTRTKLCQLMDSILQAVEV